MLTTLMFSIAAADSDPSKLISVRELELSVKKAVGRSLAGIDEVRAAELAPLMTSQSGEFSFVLRRQPPSILKVSEQAAEEVPTGMAAVYLESNRPVLSQQESVTLHSMLNALKLSQDPKIVELPSSTPRAFKVTTVANEVAVDPKDASQQAIYSSIQSSVMGI